MALRFPAISINSSVPSVRRTFLLLSLVLVRFLLLDPVPSMGVEVPPRLPFDHSEWDQFLKKFVNEKGEVDYRAAGKEPELLNAYLAKLKSFPVKEFSTWPREEQIALLINAFNAGVVKSILGHYPLKSVMNVPGGWEQALVQIGSPEEPGIPSKRTAEPGKEGWEKAFHTHSLNQIENNFLRSSFRDEKILFALCRGAKGSPPLRREAYLGPRLEGQLYLATREFVNNSEKNRIEPGEKKIILSRLFEWYGADFLLNWGNFPQREDRWDPREMAVLSFFVHYLEDPKKAEYLREGKYKVKYDIFDWRLNEWQKP